MNTINRLQLRHHTPIFETREAAIEYIYSQIRFADEGLAFEDKRYGFSLLGEPTVLLYKNVTEADPTGENDPHLIFAIGSATNEGTQYNDNRFCIIDIDKTEKEVEDLWEELEKAIKSLSIVTKNTNTLKLYSEKTESGTVISGDVVVATSQIFDDARKPNIILNTEDGLFTYVNMEVDEETGHISFTVNGNTKEWTISDNYLVKGYYSKKDESLHLLRKDGEDVVVSLENLIDEWGVEGEASNTPIVLTKEEVGYGDDALHNHVEPWQDVLKADVRLADRKYNILKKTTDGRYLYVDGLANNIIFFKDGEEMTVQEALTNATKGASNDSTNIIYEKADGYYSTATLKYLNKENKLVFTTSNVTGGTSVEEIKLNSVEAFKKIVYDPVTETLIIMYVDGNGDIQECDVPIGEMMQDWEWDILNDGHNVKLHKQRVVGGNDKVSADVAIYEDPDNILVDKNHELFVKGTADNIRYGRNGNVNDELDKLNANDASINAKLTETSGKVDTLRTEFDAEVNRATGEEQRIENKLDAEISRSTAKDAEHDSKISTIEQTIGDGFTIDGHETVTYKFNELSAKTNTISAKTDTIDANLGLLSAKTEAEIVRANSEEQRIEKKFDDELGDGFSIRNTVRDEFNREKAERVGEDTRLQGEIDAISANTEGRLIDVINNDHSINVDKTDQVRPVISVNISDEEIEGMPNVIKLNSDGLYAGVDLDYHFESGTSKNVLVFKTTNGTKTFDLKTNSVIDKIYYDPIREAIIIEYTVNGQRMPDVVIPVHDLIDEWRVSEDTNGAIKLYKTRESGATQDVLYAESVISDHEDNILVNDNGALYVSNAQIEQNKADIASLSDRMNEAEGGVDSLENALAAEISRAEGEEQRIEEKLDREISRSTTEDDNIWKSLRTEVARSTEKDNEHDGQIAEEIQRAKDAEHTLYDKIVAEATRAINAESGLSRDITDEVARAERTEEELRNAISAQTLNFKDTTSIDFERVGTDVTAIVKVATDSANTITNNLTGLYSTVDFEYNGVTNKLTLKRNNLPDKEIQLNAGSIVDRIEYDSVHKNIIIIYKTAAGETRTVTIPAEELVNEWTVDNDGTPIKLTKTLDPSGVTDVLRADVKIAAHTDNLLMVDGDALYVPGDIVASAATIAECVSGKTDSIYKTLFGDAAPGGCGEGIEYKPDVHNCIISAATSFQDADQLMAYQLCEIMEMWVSGETCTTQSEWVDDGANKKMIVDVKLSRGNGVGGEFVEDEEIIINNCTGDYIDPTNTEFTDTNALRIVCVEDCGGVTPSIDTPQNGIYLSNVWDCGLYYDEHDAADIEARHKADAAGYNTNYLSEDQPSSYDYNNNVR